MHNLAPLVIAVLASVCVCFVCLFIYLFVVSLYVATSQHVAFRDINKSRNGLLSLMGY